MAFRVGIDTGGTFTDVVAFDPRTGDTFTTKTPTTPDDPSVGFMRGLSRIAAEAGFGLSEIGSVSHGTTVATNALLADEFTGLGLIVTRGFRHLLEIARQSVPQGYGNSYFWVKPERIVPLQRVGEVTERLTARGEVLRAFDMAEAEAVAAWFRDEGITSIGVCFLHAYANDQHERLMAEVLARVHPHADVSLSSAVLPEYREYERAVTTLVDAFVKPRVARYIEQIQERVSAQLGPGTPFYVMQSNGGVLSAREVARHPITTILSGPAAGALGAALLARAGGFERVLTLDGGGTSTDVAVVEGGVPHLTTEGRVGRFPVKVPMIDVVTVGSGGGSIASLGPDGRLRVGPGSAGAHPGPMCYGRGGDQPTITDAALVLGRIPPHLLGGEIPLDIRLAERGLESLADRLGLDLPHTAAGILEIAAWSQANAVRQATVKRGLDVRDYVLVAFGGSGPLSAGRLLDVLGLRAALVPLDPGNVSAFGLLTVDLKNEYVATTVEGDDRLDLERLESAFGKLEDQATTALAREGIASDQMEVVRSADMRYFGQSSEVRVGVPAGALTRARADVAVGDFHSAHEKTYGYCYRDQAQQRVEWVNARVTGIGPIQRPALRTRSAAAGDVERARTGRRQVFLEDRFHDTAVYARRLLGPGDCISGPAVVEEFGSTTVIYPGQAARVDTYGNLLLERA